MSSYTDLEARLRYLEETLAAQRTRARRLARWRIGAVAAALLLGAAVAVADPTTPTPCNTSRSSSLYCFVSNNPALASSVNSNFETLATWLESKVGTYNPNPSDAAPTNSGGIVLVGNTSGAHLALDGDELLARNGATGAALFVQEGAGAGDTVLNTNAGRVIIGGAGPVSTAKLQVNGLTTASSLQVGGGTTLTKIAMGTIGNCSVPNSAGSGSNVSFGTTFTTIPEVFLTVEEPDFSGCTSARVNQRTASSFSFQGWTGSTLTACDCIHWLAIGN